MASAKKLPSGNWRVLKYTGTENGKRKYASYTAPTKKEAEYLAALAQIEFKKQSDEKAKNGITLGEAIDRYIDAKRAVLSPKTIAEYVGMRNRAFDDLMPLHQDELTAERVQASVSLYAASHSPKSVRNAVGLLSAACGMFFPNLKIKPTLPQKKKTSISIPTTQQIKDILALSEGTEMYTVLLLASSLGIRRSELCALNISDVDFKNKTITINKAIVQNEHGAWIIKSTKNTESERVLKDIPDYILNHLFSLELDGERIINTNPSAITQRYIKLRKKCGMTCRLHDLRHYHASFLLALGIPDKYAMKRMGHSTPHMLKTVYQHLMDSKKDEVDEAISAKLTELFR